MDSRCCSLSDSPDESRVISCLSGRACFQLVHDCFQHVTVRHNVHFAATAATSADEPTPLPDRLAHQPTLCSAGRSVGLGCSLQQNMVALRASHPHLSHGNLAQFPSKHRALIVFAPFSLPCWAGHGTLCETGRFQRQPRLSRALPDCHSISVTP